jgi:MspA protein
VFKPFRAGAIVLALLTAGGGVAVADPVSVGDVSQYVDTVNKYRLTVSLSRVTINPVPNMAVTAFSREGFISGLAIEHFEGEGTVPVDMATLRLWVQFGCQIDLRAGANLSGSLTNALLVPFTVADIFGTPAVGASAPSESFSPSITATVRPGNIFRAQLAIKEAKTNPPDTLYITVRDTEVKVDGCGGPVSVRLIATAQMTTANSDDWVNAYSDILQL